MRTKPVYVYHLDIVYPEGSQKQGWFPSSWYEMPDRQLRKAIKKGFTWPRERMYLSADGAYGRAWLLRWCGAKVKVQRSAPVTWPGSSDPGYYPDISSEWTYHRGQLSPDLPDEDISHCSPEIYYQDPD